MTKACRNMNGELLHEGAFSAISSVARTDTGRCRTENQDAFSMVEGKQFRIYALADGMGGAKGGSIASKLAIETLSSSMKGWDEIHEGHLVAAFRRANSAIFDEAAESAALKGMGTTLVAVAITREHVYVANVGDSRAYRFRDGTAVQLTHDHTVVGELQRAGVLNHDQARHNPVSHVLTRSLGPSPSVEVDCRALDDKPSAGDFYLLCSDGLYNLVSPREMSHILSSLPLDEAIERMIALANHRGGQDNITVVGVSVGEGFDKEQVDAHSYTGSSRATVKLQSLNAGSVTLREKGEEKEPWLPAKGMVSTFSSADTGTMRTMRAKTASLSTSTQFDKKFRLILVLSAVLSFACTASAGFYLLKHQPVRRELAAYDSYHRYPVVRGVALTDTPPLGEPPVLEDAHQRELKRLELWEGIQSRLSRGGALNIVPELVPLSPRIRKARDEAERARKLYLALATEVEGEEYKLAKEAYQERLKGLAREVELVVKENISISNKALAKFH